MTALAKSRYEHEIADEIHAVMALYPGRSNDADFIISPAAEAMSRPEADVRRVWMERFHIGGVC